MGKDLFSAGIVQSGGFWLQSLASSQNNSARVVSKTTCAPNATNKGTNLLACLRSLKGTDLLHSQAAAGWRLCPPCADGYEYPLNATQSNVVSAGHFKAKAMMVGTNRNESALFHCGKVPRDLNEGQMRQRLASNFQIGGPDSALANSIASLYNGSRAYGGSWRRAYIDVWTDRVFACDSNMLLDAIVRQGEPAYAYRLLHAPYWFGADRCLGVPHLSDVFFLFGNFDHVLETQEVALGRRMRQYWLAFAANHSMPGDHLWPPYGEKRQYIVFDTPHD